MIRQLIEHERKAYRRFCARWDDVTERVEQERAIMRYLRRCHDEGSCTYGCPFGDQPSLREALGG